MDRTVCTEPQCLYSIAIPLLPLWAVRPVQSLSACARVHFLLCVLGNLMNWLSHVCNELISIWVWALLGQVHLGLKTGPLCPMFYTKLKEPCSFSKVTGGLYTWFSNILQVQKEGTRMCMSEWSQGLTLAQNEDRFLPQYHISYKWGCYSAPLYINFFSMCHVQ